MKCWTALTVLAGLVLLPRPCPGAANIAVDIKDNDHLDVLVDGKVQTRYMFAYDKSTPQRLFETYKPYLHVFDVEGKRPITNGAGGEYPHHRGIFIGWNKISVAGKMYDRWHMKTGEIVHQSFTADGAAMKTGDDAASFTAINHWNNDDGKPFLIEERTQVVRAAGGPLRLIIDFTSKLTAQGEDVKLDGDPEHAGIHFRPANDVDRAKTLYVFPTEKPDAHKDIDYPWVGETFTLTDGGAQGGATYSVVEISHVGNPKNARWSAYRNYGRFGAFPVATIKAGESLTLRYRFLIADGAMPALDVIEKSANEFSPGIALTHTSTVVPAEQPAPKVEPRKEPKKEAARPQAALPTPAAAQTAKRVQKKTNRPGPVDAPLLFNLPPPAPLKVDAALKTFALPSGYRIEPVAAEPMVETPIAISFDERGRMYVVEMRSYMLDVENEHEMDPIGRIKLLEDSDGDGRMDRASVFVDGLVMPRAVLAIRGGALVAEPPTLSFYEDTNGDGVADKKTIVASDYGVKGGQPEQMANTPMVGLDNWIYSSVYSQRFRFTRGKWAAEPTRTRGQYGLAQDDFGRFFFATNSDVARGMPLPSGYFDRNPFYRARAATDVSIIDTQEVWPSHPTPGVNRGYEKTQLRPDGTLATATGACGSAIYRGDLMPEMYGNLFTPEPCGNLMKRMIVTDSGGKLAATNAYPNREFLASTDERFRPVFATTGPDGALYVVDMYQGVLQHYYFLTHYLIKNIKARNLESPVNWGRIYRIVPANKSARAMKMPEKPVDLVGLLAHANGWVRDTAQRLLIEKNDRSVVPVLKKMAINSPQSLGRLHALWTLEGLGRLDQPILVKALADKDAKVRAAAIRLSEPLLAPTTRQQFQPTLLKLAGDPSADVQLQLVLTLGAFHEPPVMEMVGNFLTKSAADEAIMRDAVLSGLRGRELEFTEYLLTRSDWSKQSPAQKSTLTALAQCVVNERRPNRIGRIIEIAAAQPAGSWRQAALLEGLAPPVDLKARPATMPVGKLVYLDEAPKGLDGLLSADDTQVRDLATRLNLRLAWPGKPGVPPAPVIRPLTSQEQVRFDHGKMVYTQICTTCHQPNGYGLEGTAPPLIDSEWVLGPPARNVRIVLHGLTGALTINGGAFKGEMPALPTLSDEDIAAVLTYIRREWDHGADPVDEQTVAAIREEAKARADLWTAKELLEIK